VARISFKSGQFLYFICLIAALTVFMRMVCVCVCGVCVCGCVVCVCVVCVWCVCECVCGVCVSVWLLFFLLFGCDWFWCV